MQYKGWNLEKTLLISNKGSARACEFVDVRIPLDARYAGNLENDVRVVLKSDWDYIVRELPSQVYQVEREGDVAACRVAFVMDVPANEMQRIGIYYDNPDASAPEYRSPLQMNGGALGGTIETPLHIVSLDEASGQIRNFIFNMRQPSKDAKPMSASERLQEHAAVVFAVRDDAGNVRAEYASPAQWNDPEIVEDVRGPLFVKLVRRAKLAWPGCPEPERCPELQVGYRFFAHQPFFLVHTRLTFIEDTEVFGVRVGGMSVESGTYSHYTFRPVTLTLPETDVEEMGHILIDPEYTNDLPLGSAFSSLIPYDIAWHAFIRVRKGLDRGMGIIQLRHAVSSDFPRYRAATYMFREPDGFSCARVPVYVKAHRESNIVTVPAGAVVENLDAVAYDLFDSKWGDRMDLLGKRLNSPLQIIIHPRFMLGEVPPETPEPLPRGERADAYRRYGVR